MATRSHPSTFSPTEDEPARRATCAYWLAHAQGFRVESPAGRIGLVEDVRCSLEDGSASLLVVRAGRLGRTVLAVSVSEVEAVTPRETRILLRENARLSPVPQAPSRRPHLRLAAG